MRTVDRPRVAVITSAHPALDGRIFRKQATSLARAGYDVMLVAPNAEGVEAVVTAAGMSFVPLRAGGERRDRPRRWLDVARFLWHNRRSIRAWHVHDPELLALCAPLRLLIARRIRLVYDAHEDYPAATLSKAWIPASLRRPTAIVTSNVERALANTCALVIGATPGISERFRSRPRRPVVTIHNYPLSDRGTNGRAHVRTRAPDGHVRCVYVGGLTAIRGIRETVAAFANLSDTSVELVLAGQFESESFEHEVLTSLPPNVSYLGTVAWEEVPTLLEESDIGMLCFLPEPNHVESLPTKMFEYFDAGLPVIASDITSWNPYVSDIGLGLQVDPTDPAAIAGAVRTLAAQPDVRMAMGERARTLAHSSFTWEHEARSLVAAYGSMLGNRHSAVARGRARRDCN